MIKTGYIFYIELIALDSIKIFNK